MTEPIITCPNCRTEIKLTESLAAPLIEATRQQYEKKVAESEASIASRELALRQQQDALAEAEKSIEDQVESKLRLAREKIAVEESRKARLLFEGDIEQTHQQITDLQELLKDRDTKLGEAQKAQAEIIRKQRELDDAKREIDLTIERRVEESITLVRDKAKVEAEEKLRFKVLEKEEQIASMQRQIEELRRKAEQGSQQIQGEVQELELETLLRSKFQRDTIEPLPKGEFGGDVLHRVLGPTGQHCGTILWESKRTKKLE